jgi:hypothetical protein
MPIRRFSIAVIALVAVVAFPNEGRASFWDYIWEMSGPQMFQLVSFSYPIAFKVRPKECEVPGATCPEVGGRVFSRKAFFLDDAPLHPPKDKKDKLLHLADRQGPRFWLVVETSAYTSTGKNSGQDEYEFGQTFMVAAEPLFEYRAAASKSESVTFYVGAGPSYQYLFGNDFEHYDKFGLKFRPIGIIIARHLDLGYNVRVYPHGFTPDEFGHGERRENYDRPAETTWGFSVGILW